MKQSIAILSMLLSTALLTSCKKELKPASLETFLGKWNIEKDTYYQGIGMNNVQVTYTGKSGDYYDFREDGKVYIKEDTHFDTLTFNTENNTTIRIESFGLEVNGQPPACPIVYLSNSSISISSPTSVTAGGQFGRSVILYR